MGLDCYKHKRNLNVLVVGGSGAGKSRAYAVVNIMQCNCSMVITDPKGELLRKTGGLLEREGYEVRVFDLINPENSFCYNPFAYVRDDKDVLKLINNLIRNTTPKGAQSSDPFWEKSETALLQALMLYLLHEAPPEEQNFSMIMEMLGSAQVKEDDEEYQSPLDILFERLEMRNPESIAVKQYAIYKQAAGKTAKSILISVGVRLAAFNLKQIANLTCTDELDLYSIGEKKVALFCCIPDADTSLNYLSPNLSILSKIWSLTFIAVSTSKLIKCQSSIFFKSSHAAGGISTLYFICPFSQSSSCFCNTHGRLSFDTLLLCLQNSLS